MSVKTPKQQREADGAESFFGWLIIITCLSCLATCMAVPIVAWRWAVGL